MALGEVLAPDAVSISSRATLLSTTPSGEVTEALAHRLGPNREQPALRKDLVIRHLVQMGESKWVVKNPDSLKIYTFTDAEWGLVELFDGQRTHTDIRDAYVLAHPGDRIETSLVLDYEENLQKMDLLAQSGSERGLALMQRLRDARKLKAEEKEKSFNIFLMLFPIADPNEFLNKTVKYVRWIWSPEVVSVGLVLFGLTAAVFVRDFSKIWTETVHLYAFLDKPFIDVLQFYLIVTFIAMFHELGHAYTMKMYGGEVHSIGFALFFFLPAYFTDTMDSELFESKWHRLWVNVGGIYIESYICVAATALWLATYPDTFIHAFAYKGMLYTGISTVFFNINPLTPTDGYHAVEDLLEIPELRPQSFQYLGALIQKYIFRLPVEVPVLSKRKRRIFLIYGPLASLYMGSIMVAIGALFNHVIGMFAGEWTTLLTLLLCYRMFRKKIRKFTDVLRMFYLDKKEYLMSRKVQRRLAAGAAIVFLVLIIPWPHETFEVPIVLKPSAAIQVAAPADATVEAVEVHEGDRVAAGHVLARLSSRAVESRIQELTAKRNGFENQASFGREMASAADSTAFESRAVAATSALKATEAVRDALLVRSPVGGTILTHRPQDLLGSSVAVGAPLLTVGDLRRLRVEIPVTERLIQSLRVGEPVIVHVPAYPFRKFHAQITEIAPAAQTMPATSRAVGEPLDLNGLPEKFVAVALLDNAGGELEADMTAQVKLIGPRRAYAVQWWNIFYHWTRRIFW
ncbi:MAG: efflux RND transporter periplasmic adaptor subunit [Thermoanaerobaculia bacterium]